MAHARESIRKAVVAAVTGLATTGTNVINWRLHAVSGDDLPQLAVMVGGGGEAVTDAIEGKYSDGEIRDIAVTIEARVAQAGTSTTVIALDTLDDICAEVEVAMMTDIPLSALILYRKLDTTEISVEAGERPALLATQEWVIRYAVDRTNP